MYILKFSQCYILHCVPVLQVNFLQKRASLLQEDLDASRSRRLAWLFRLYRKYVHTCQFVVHVEVCASVQSVYSLCVWTMHTFMPCQCNLDSEYRRVWISNIIKRLTIYPASVAMTVSSAEGFAFPPLHQIIRVIHVFMKSNHIYALIRGLFKWCYHWLLCRHLRTVSPAHHSN